MSGAVQTWPRTLLLLEGATLFGSAIWGYSRLGRSWWTFAGLLLLPDLGMVGFAANNAVGAAVYNAVHTEAPALVLLCAATAWADKRLAGVALTWLAHVGMDRMLGFGLKYATGFGHTHLGRIG